MTDVAITESAYLVALDPDKGRLPRTVNHSRFLCLAATADLLTGGVLTVSPACYLGQVTVTATGPAPDGPLHRILFDAVAGASHPVLLSSLVNKADFIVHRDKRAEAVVRAGLQARGFVDEAGGPVAPDHRDKLLGRIAGGQPSQQDLRTFAVLHAVGLDARVFDRATVKQACAVLAASDEKRVRPASQGGLHARHCELSICHDGNTPPAPVAAQRQDLPVHSRRAIAFLLNDRPAHPSLCQAQRSP